MNLKEFKNRESILNHEIKDVEVKIQKLINEIDGFKQEKNVLSKKIKASKTDALLTGAWRNSVIQMKNREKRLSAILTKANDELMINRSKLKQLRKELNTLRNNSYERAFENIAHSILPPELFWEISFKAQQKSGVWLNESSS
ncbi:hypothetical protein [Lysinibacillus antri]|uniref:Uncharacterized protein n=1 Tax=Lysinibacillus antri TaxID=2498145 RepID=A0A432LFX7_9BACI|nr:hypothetical protein [Lysinibacillus antri]RUL56489.1 hypothetical protein EK386_02330 [Lysinibacillus antri]